MGLAYQSTRKQKNQISREITNYWSQNFTNMFGTLVQARHLCQFSDPSDHFIQFYVNFIIFKITDSPTVGNLNDFLWAEHTSRPKNEKIKYLEK